MTHPSTGTGTDVALVALGAGRPRLAVRHRPGELRPFVLVHGLASNARLWDDAATALAAAGHQTLALDLRGHGMSDVPPDGYDTDTCADDVAALIDVLGLAGDRAPVVVGQSWGGNVVLSLAARHPGTVAALACVDGGWIRLHDAFASFADCWAALAPPRFDHLRYADVARLIRSAHPDWRPTAIDATLANLEELPDGGVRARLARSHHESILRSMYDGDPARFYPLVAVPALLVPALGEPTPPTVPAPPGAGDADDADDDPWSSAQRAAVGEALAALPHAEVRRYRGADHDLHAQHPERLAADLLALVGRVAQAAPGPLRGAVTVSLLVVMGSGETAPTMVKLHRQIFEATDGDGPAVLLDTPFGFQLNADALVDRAVAYFADSVGVRVEAARWRRADAAVADAERALALLSRASWAFAGPGSPSYALRQWTGTAVPDALTDVVERGGTLVVGSAAACTIGTHAIPVYEIYKVGEDPRWLPGLDLFGRITGIRAALVPHFDNTEGGASHDTRFCYLGEPRLVRLEAELPEGIGVLGVDEHTALVVDVQARVARVAGNGRVTIRHRGGAHVLPSGSELALDALDALLHGVAATDGATPVGASVGTTVGAGAAAVCTGATSADPVAAATDRELPSLGVETRDAQQRFDHALAARDVEGCVTAVLDLESAIVAWSADTDQNDDADRAHRALRAMIVQLGELAECGARDPRDAVGPYVELALELRGRAREGRDYAAADLIRERLATAGVEVRDTPDGASWHLAQR